MSWFQTLFTRQEKQVEQDEAGSSQEGFGTTDGDIAERATALFTRYGEVKNVLDVTKEGVPVADRTYTSEELEAAFASTPLSGKVGGLAKYGITPGMIRYQARLNLKQQLVAEIARISSITDSDIANIPKEACVRSDAIVAVLSSPGIRESIANGSFRPGKDGTVRVVVYGRRIAIAGNMSIAVAKAIGQMHSAKMKSTSNL